MSIEIVPISRINLKDAVNVAVSVFGEHNREGVEVEFKASAGSSRYLKKVENELRIVNPSYFIAYKDGIPAGTTGYYGIKGHDEDIWLGWMCVAQQFKGQNLGAALVEGAFAKGLTDRIRNFRIWMTQLPKYEGARKLYNTLGFSEEIYVENATDSRKLISVFSKAADPNQVEHPSWKTAPYKIDCETYEIDYLNKKFGLPNQQWESIAELAEMIEDCNLFSPSCLMPSAVMA